MPFLSQECPSSSFPAQQLMLCAQPRQYPLTGTFPVPPAGADPYPGSPVPCTGLSHITCPFALNTCLQLSSLTAVGRPKGRDSVLHLCPSGTWRRAGRMGAAQSVSWEGEEKGRKRAPGRQWGGGQRGKGALGQGWRQTWVGGSRELRVGYYLLRIPDSLSFHSQLFLCVS